MGFALENWLGGTEADASERPAGFVEDDGWVLEEAEVVGLDIALSFTPGSVRSQARRLSSTLFVLIGRSRIPYCGDFVAASIFECAASSCNGLCCTSRPKAQPGLPSVTRPLSRSPRAGRSRIPY